MPGITWSEGSFPQESGGASESDNSGSHSGANSYSLQMNTNRFWTPACNSASCTGWQQFVYDPLEQNAYMQYWMIGYVGDCPDGWNSTVAASQPSCWMNSALITVPSEPASNLTSLSITAWTTQTTTEDLTDYMTMTVGGMAYHLNQTSRLNLQGAWTDTEFNVFGEDNGTQAAFNSPTTLEVQVLVSDDEFPTRAAPSCPAGSSTAETNTMSIIPGSCCPFGGNSPGVQFLESTNSSAPVPACPTLALSSYTVDFGVNTVTAPAGSTITGTVSVVGGLVDSSLNAGLAPNSCTVNGDGTVVDIVGEPQVTFDLAPGSAGASWVQTITCDTGGTIAETVDSVASVFGASPTSVSLVPGGASGDVSWQYTAAESQFCLNATYAIDGALPYGITGSWQGSLLVLQAAPTTPLGTYTVLVNSSGCSGGSVYTAAVTVDVVSCIPKTCNVNSCQGEILDGCGSTLLCPTSCASPDTCVGGICEAPVAPPPPPTCNGVRRPISACAAPNAWKCCSSWVCARLCSAPREEREEADIDEDVASGSDEIVVP